ncbi:MAG: oligosaccharide flippase family protein [Oscillospiraceae bacterium]
MNLKFRLANSNKGVLLQNTVMLYLLTFSNYFLSLVVVPYETRVLGVEVFGVLGAATAIMVYFQLVVDFGFLLSGTQEVAKSRDDPVCRQPDFHCHNSGKAFAHRSIPGRSDVAVPSNPRMAGTPDALSAVFLRNCCEFLDSGLPLPRLRENVRHYHPYRLYQGLFTLGIVVFMKAPEDVWMVPAINAIGCLAALGLTLLHLNRKLGIRFTSPDWSEAIRSLKRSSTFFYSRIATTAYSALNTVILDMISASGATVGYYSSADRLITTGKNALSPISDSLYPYMVKNRDFKLVRKILLIFEPLIFLFCAAVFIWAEPICVLIFGPDFAPAANVLRAMLPIGVITLPSYILGFPTLTAMGLTEHANYSVIFGSALHVVNLAVLYFSGNMNMITLGCAVSVAEALILGYRIWIVWRHRSILQREATP